MNAARANLYHANLPATYWENAIRDAAYKYNILPHSATHQAPYTLWHDQPAKPKQLLIFGQLWTVPVYAHKKKLESRSRLVRYMFANNPRSTTVQDTHTNQYHKVRTQDFLPYTKAHDPAITTTAVLRTTSPSSPPPTLQITTPDPRTIQETRNYPDVQEWARARDAELSKLDDSKTIKWIPYSTIPKHEKLIPFNMTFRYIRDRTGAISARKARCVARGDRMTPGKHYDPNQVTTHMADKTTVRLQLPIATSCNWSLEHMDISSAYLHERFPQTKRVYIKQHPRFNGTFKHPGKAGLLIRNIYGTSQAARIYHNGLFKNLTSHGYRPTEADPCLLFKKSHKGTILVALNMDDFLSVASTQLMYDDLHTTLTAKYKIKRLGFPAQYLKWHIPRLPHGSIHISQPQVATAILTKTGMLSANPKGAPLPPKAAFTLAHDNTPLEQHQAFLCRQTIGDLRYLVDSTRPDIHPAVSMLASVMHKPAKEHKTTCTVSYATSAVQSTTAFSSKQVLDPPPQVSARTVTPTSRTITTENRDPDPYTCSTAHL